jgi:hypothetical protein
MLPSRFEALVLAGALSRLGCLQNPILPIYRQREVGFIARQSRMQTIVVPGVFRGFDFPPMIEEATAGLDGIRCRFGRNLRFVMLVTCVPMPPLFFD